MMVEKTLGIDIDPEYLDATDALAIALCHFYQSSNPFSSSRGKGDWKSFIASNPDRIK